MATSFSSRLSSLRQRKSSSNQEEENKELKLTLPSDLTEKSSYEPTATFNNTRTSMRLLKGRIEKGQSTEKYQIPTQNMYDSKGISSNNKLTMPFEEKQELRLTLNDPTFQQKKVSNEPPRIPLQKRVLIAKEPPKEEIKPELPPRKVEEEIKPEKIEKREEPIKVNSQQQKPIREEEVQESGVQENQNDLVLCSEGCGRKFNRKALEKHVKACKAVFMSKRKEFNSEAKRITSKEQAVIVKQTKLKEKKEMGMTKGKGFGQTGDNWKAASEDFRSAIKAMKKEEKQQNQDQEEGQKEEQVVQMIVCEFCQKKFNQVFMEKHLENCLVKKQKQKEKEKEKKKTTKK